MDGPPLWRQTHRHGRGRATDLPQVRGQSDFNTACRWHGTADVAVFRVRPPGSYEKRSSNGLDQERATATQIDARTLVPSSNGPSSATAWPMSNSASISITLSAAVAFRKAVSRCLAPFLSG